MTGICILVLLGFFGIQVASSENISLVVKGHDGPVMEGDDITLECLSDTNEDVSTLSFQKYSKWMYNWITLDPKMSFRCWYYEVNITRENGQLLLHLNNIQTWQSGPYRCVSNNSVQTEVSNNVTIPVNYLRDISLYRTGFFSRYVDNLKMLTVATGEDVEVECSAYSSSTPLYEWSRDGDDWIIVSNKLKLEKISMEQAGTYTCKAINPSISELYKSKSFMLRVVKEAKKEFGVSEFYLILAIAAPAISLLVIIVAFAIYMHKRKTSTEKMVQDDSTQRSPIYKGSLDSLPSVTSDTYPLVI